MASTSNGRCSSSEEEEAERSVELNESKRVRRRRGRRTRKKSERDSPSSDANGGSPLPPLPESRKRTCSLGAPPAPRNTNDFLIEDMEKRAEPMKRLRRESMREDGVSGLQPEGEGAAGSEDEDDGMQLPGEDEFEDQYEASWQECVIDKYKEMNHEELARRMAIMEKNRDEVERKLRWERSKSDYLQERLLEAEEQIRNTQEDGSAAPSEDSAPSPPPPVPSVPPPSSCVGLPIFGSCSPNVISSPRA